MAYESVPLDQFSEKFSSLTGVYSPRARQVEVLTFQRAIERGHRRKGHIGVR